MTAQVFLRSASGRSLRDLAGVSDLADLPKYHAPPAARAAAIAKLEAAGFRVFPDEMGIALSIQAAPGVFEKVFGSVAVPSSGAATVRLRAPPDLDDLVEEISLLPPPEWH